MVQRHNRIWNPVEKTSNSTNGANIMAGGKLHSWHHSQIHNCLNNCPYKCILTSKHQPQHLLSTTGKFKSLARQEMKCYVPKTIWKQLTWGSPSGTDNVDGTLTSPVSMTAGLPSLRTSPSFSILIPSTVCCQIINKWSFCQLILFLYYEFTHKRGHVHNKCCNYVSHISSSHLDPNILLGTLFWNIPQYMFLP